MKLHVSPELNKKLASLAAERVREVSQIVEFIRTTEAIVPGETPSGIEIRSLGGDIITFRKGDCRIYASIGQDAEEKYVLLLDIASVPSNPASSSRFFSTKDPKTNPLIDPNRNSLIDPRRNMMIDPRRNMMIDPQRNMMIDPKRNMMIDPKRNMMIDPKRNMMIDPQRNMMIDPRRNMMIDPRRNKVYGGPYLYNTNLEQEGFLVRANEDVNLIFDMLATYVAFSVSSNVDGANIFDRDGRWVGFLRRTQQEVWLRFDTKGAWTGIIV